MRLSEIATYSKTGYHSLMIQPILHPEHYTIIYMKIYTPNKNGTGFQSSVSRL